jgi:hypothetical protein
MAMPTRIIQPMVNRHPIGEVNMKLGKQEKPGGYKAKLNLIVSTTYILGIAQSNSIKVRS